MNINADTLASYLAAAIGAERLVIAGGTSGVLDDNGRTIERLTVRQAARLIKAGTPTRAWWQSCRRADGVQRGVGDW